MPARAIALPMASALVGALLCGCVPYPVHKTLQPESRATVRDADGRPLAGARVELIVSSYPYGRERWRRAASTGGDGQARFPAEREWRAESLMIHGSTTFFWNWCVQREGFATMRTLHRDPDAFETALDLRLAPGESQPCERP